MKEEPVTPNRVTTRPASRRRWWRRPRSAPPPHAASAAIDDMLVELERRENDVLKGETLKQQAAELRRQRTEVLSELDIAMSELRSDVDVLSSQIGVLSTMKEEAAGLPEELPDDDAAALGLARRVVEGGRIEIAKVARLQEASAGAGGLQGLSDLGFLALTRIGLGLLWPLAMAVLVAGAAIAGALVWLFKIG